MNRASEAVIEEEDDGSMGQILALESRATSTMEVEEEEDDAGEGEWEGEGDGLMEKNGVELDVASESVSGDGEEPGSVDIAQGEAPEVFVELEGSAENLPSEAELAGESDIRASEGAEAAGSVEPLKVPDTPKKTAGTDIHMVPDKEEGEVEVAAMKASTPKSKNYASKDSGAVMLEYSPSMKGSENLLVDSRDKYAITPCEDRQHVVIALSEDILVRTIMLQSYERYSGLVTKFQVLASQVYPTEEWMDLGVFDVPGLPGTHSVDLSQQAFARYLKFKFLSHSGVDEYYCTLSQVNVYGSTMLESFQSDLQAAHEEVEVIKAGIMQNAGSVDGDAAIEPLHRGEEQASQDMPSVEVEGKTKDTSGTSTGPHSNPDAAAGEDEGEGELVIQGGAADGGEDGEEPPGEQAEALDASGDLEMSAEPLPAADANAFSAHVDQNEFAERTEEEKVSSEDVLEEVALPADLQSESVAATSEDNFDDAKNLHDLLDVQEVEGEEEEQGRAEKEQEVDGEDGDSEMRYIEQSQNDEVKYDETDYIPPVDVGGAAAGASEPVGAAEVAHVEPPPRIKEANGSVDKAVTPQPVTGVDGQLGWRNSDGLVSPCVAVPFQEFRDQMMAKMPQKEQARLTKGIGGQYETIFTTLLNKIHTLEINQSLFHMYIENMGSCYLTADKQAAVAVRAAESIDGDASCTEAAPPPSDAALEMELQMLRAEVRAATLLAHQATDGSFCPSPDDYAQWGPVSFAPAVRALGDLRDQAALYGVDDRLLLAGSALMSLGISLFLVAVSICGCIRRKRSPPPHYRVYSSDDICWVEGYRDPPPSAQPQTQYHIFRGPGPASSSSCAATGAPGLGYGKQQPHRS
jgi:hypothetical protein